MNKSVDKLLEEGSQFTFENNSIRGEDGDTWVRTTPSYQAWIIKLEDFILETYGEDSPPFRQFKRFDIKQMEGSPDYSFVHGHSILIGALKACQSIEPKKRQLPITKEIVLENIFDRFHSIAIQLRSRYSARPTLDVADEYDVQDLLHAILKLNFNDIRKEEWTPSYAGGSSRMDFLLKDEQIVIEVKKTRVGLGEKQLGTQLIEDKAKYKAHPDCKKLICFTYDPEGRILNPKGLQRDLNQDDQDFKVVIVIKPDH